MEIIECKNLTKIYFRKTVLKNLSFTLEENKIIGLIGRNEVGKITLLKIISGFINGFDFSPHIKPVNFHMNDDTLNITYPDHQKINISVVRKEFTINQFTGQNPINEMNGDGQLAVYLIIPKSLQLHSENAQFQYVRDKGRQGDGFLVPIN